MSFVNFINVFQIMQKLFNVFFLFLDILHLILVCLNSVTYMKFVILIDIVVNCLIKHSFFGKYSKLRIFIESS